AEIVAMGAIYTSWGLDDWTWKSASSPGKNPVDSNYQRMIKNVFDRYSTGVAPEVDAGPDSGSVFDAGPMADADPVEKDVGAAPDVELVDVSDVGAADTFVPPEDATVVDTTTPDATTMADATKTPETAAEDDSATVSQPDSAMAAQDTSAQNQGGPVED